jgi:hypothetical protein
MSNPILDDLKRAIANLPPKEDYIIFLPCNERYELVGIDSEVVNFHARQIGWKVIRIKNYELERDFLQKGKVFMMKDKPMDLHSARREMDNFGYDFYRKQYQNEF